MASPSRKELSTTGISHVVLNMGHQTCREHTRSTTARRCVAMLFTFMQWPTCRYVMYKCVRVKASRVLQARAHAAPADALAADPTSKKRKTRDISSYTMTEQQRRSNRTLLARAIFEGGMPLSFVDRPATKRFTQVNNTTEVFMPVLGQNGKLTCSA